MAYTHNVCGGPVKSFCMMKADSSDDFWIALTCPTCAVGVTRGECTGAFDGTIEIFGQEYIAPTDIGKVLTSNGPAAAPTWEVGIPGPAGPAGPAGAAGANGANGVFQKTTVTLTAAQILDLHNTAVELIPAPAAGDLHVVLGVFAYLKFVTTPYTVVVGSNVCIDYLPQAGSGDLMVHSITSLMDSAFDVLQMVSPSEHLLDAGKAAAAIGSSVVVKLLAGDQLTLGDGTMKLVTYYDTVTI